MSQFLCQFTKNKFFFFSDGTAAVPANNALDVITEDLDISDDSEDEQEQSDPVDKPMPDQNKPDPPPPSEEANPPNTSEADEDGDGIWF